MPKAAAQAFALRSCGERQGGAIMTIGRRRFLHLATGAAAMPALSRVALADAYPSRPVHVIVFYTAGGGNDILARLMGQWLSQRLGPSFVVENRAGGGGKVRA